ncbi:DUF397 domain-containing protein [Streptomyces sp. NBC_01187]|uniref:DUF397 domain-containing protein n=1 Tax=Streptomyces sp. NBC_01187 TaxID=2903766 RepID=UPI00386715BA|nr:DUF397 domain-containing protein [Streptomyces sp. NBC_01187]
MCDARELDLALWHKSSYSSQDNGNCLERGQLQTGRQAVRDTKDCERGALVYDAATWQTFVDGVRKDPF